VQRGEVRCQETEKSGGRGGEAGGGNLSERDGPTERQIVVSCSRRQHPTESDHSEREEES
jgi:hypothetical protein